MGRTPDEILSDFDAVCKWWEVHRMRGLLWEVLEDVLDSITLAESTLEGGPIFSITTTVRDYLINHYGED